MTGNSSSNMNEIREKETLKQYLIEIRNIVFDYELINEYKIRIDKIMNLYGKKINKLINDE